MPYFIDVILPIPVEKAFTYSITEAEAEFLQLGMRVAVPFGKSKDVMNPKLKSLAPARGSRLGPYVHFF